MSVLEAAQEIEKLKLSSTILPSLLNSTEVAIDKEKLNTNNSPMKKLTQAKADNTAVCQPHGGKKRRAEASMAPAWQKSDYSEDMIGLHKEIGDFFHYIRPTPEESEMRRYVINSVRQAVMGVWPDVKLEVFGSYTTELYLPSSDIDIVLMGKCTSPCQQLHLIKNGLIESGIAKEETIKVLDRAIVPIIKFTHAIVDIKIDISINQDRALKSVHYIKDIIRQFPTLPKIIFVLKQFLVSRDLNEVWHGGLSSYALIAMCISLLQVHTDPEARDPDTNLGVLLQEFFELYGLNFHYERVCIRIKDGGRYLSKEEVCMDQ